MRWELPSNPDLMETSGKADSLGKFPGNFQGGDHPRKRAKFLLLPRQPWQMPTTPILPGRGAERLHAAQIDQENRALCSKLGMPHGTVQFEACADVLSEARRYEAKRIADEVAGIL